MKINIQEGSANLADLKAKMASKFPDYQFNDFGKSMFIASKSKTIGANVIVKKNKIMITGNFPTMGGRLLFALCIVLLGFLLPLIIFLSVFQPKFSKFEKELGAFVQQEYGIKP
jgi:hypothetical protein